MYRSTHTMHKDLAYITKEHRGKQEKIRQQMCKGVREALHCKNFSLRQNSHNIKSVILKSIIWWHLVLHNHHLCLVSKYLYYLKIKSMPIKQLLLISPSVQTTTNLLSVLMLLLIFDVSCKWNHTLCDFWCLASFT